MPSRYLTYVGPMKQHLFSVSITPSGTCYEQYSGLFYSLINLTLLLLFSIIEAKLGRGGADLLCLLSLLQFEECLIAILPFLFMKMSLQHAFISLIQRQSSNCQMQKISQNYPPLPHQVLQLLQLLTPLTASSLQVLPHRAHLCELLVVQSLPLDLFPLQLEPLFPQASQLLPQKISFPIPQVGKARSPTPEGSSLTLPIPFCSAYLTVLQIRPIESASLCSLLKHKKALSECSWPAGLPLRLRYVRNKRVRRVILLVDTEKLLIFIWGLFHHCGFPHFDFLRLKSIPQALPPRVGVGVLGGEYDSSDGDF